MKYFKFVKPNKKLLGLCIDRQCKGQIIIPEHNFIYTLVKFSRTKAVLQLDWVVLWPWHLMLWP